MDYFSGLAERVIDAPSALRPRLANEFEGEGLFDDEAWEEVTEEVAARPLEKPEEPFAKPARVVGEEQAPLPARAVQAAEITEENAPATKASQEAPAPIVRDAVLPLEPRVEPPPAVASIEAKIPVSTDPLPAPISPPATTPPVQEVTQPTVMVQAPVKIVKESPPRSPSRVVHVPAEVVEKPGEPVIIDRVSQIERVRQNSRIIRIPAPIEKPLAEPEAARPEPKTAKHPMVAETRPDPEPARQPTAIQIRSTPQPMSVREVAIPEPEPERNVVEIHIGRIEVRPPAQAPAPRPAPKSRSRLSLDDVLSRRRPGK
jgi:hypothetical protein